MRWANCMQIGGLLEMLTGLSVPEFISVVMTPRTKSIVSCEIPWTWGQQRKVYASWTLSQNRWLSKEKDKLFANKVKRKSSSSDSGREVHLEEQENHVKNQQQQNKARIGKKLLPYLQFDLNEDAELIAEKMVEGVNIPGQWLVGY